MVVAVMKEQEKKVFVFCNIIHKGLMKMNHTYKHVIAPPPNGLSMR